MTCIKHQGGLCKAKAMAPLLKNKVNKSKAFTYTGLDYFGPLYVKQGKYQIIIWICLFTSIATRAIHLKLADDMTLEQFLSSLRRFIARKGKLDQIVLDNAPYFKAVKKTIDTAWELVIKDPKLHSYLSDQEIEWSFIIKLSR